MKIRSEALLYFAMIRSDIDIDSLFSFLFICLR